MFLLLFWIYFIISHFDLVFKRFLHSFLNFQFVRLHTAKSRGISFTEREGGESGEKRICKNQSLGGASDGGSALHGSKRSCACNGVGGCSTRAGTSFGGKGDADPHGRHALGDFGGAAGGKRTISFLRGGMVALRGRTVDESDRIGGRCVPLGDQLYGTSVFLRIPDFGSFEFAADTLL
jgi:hypothetical protein